ncbi:hypothetical protein [Aquirhabdus sp.]|uniref:hypothetical protein n=1 Tax=Aquirhabdus sp. TaxID=2824160 RepID=UPI00396C96A1
MFTDSNETSGFFRLLKTKLLKAFKKLLIHNAFVQATVEQVYETVCIKPWLFIDDEWLF